jgi:hypothetical protein
MILSHGALLSLLLSKCDCYSHLHYRNAIVIHRSSGVFQDLKRSSTSTPPRNSRALFNCSRIAVRSSSPNPASRCSACLNNSLIRLASAHASITAIIFSRLLDCGEAREQNRGRNAAIRVVQMRLEQSDDGRPIIRSKQPPQRLCAHTTVGGDVLASFHSVRDA